LSDECALAALRLSYAARLDTDWSVREETYSSFAVVGAIWHT